MTDRDRNEILRIKYSEILKRKLFAEEDLTETLTEEEIEEIFEGIKVYFGSQTSQRRVKEHLVRLIDRFSGEN